MAAPSQINSESKANGNATLMPDIKDDARAPNGSTKVIVKPDAGLRSQEHYKNRLGRWRYAPRQWIIPAVRWETPYLAVVQRRTRCAALDSYFSVTANLGTHTFFMTALPMLFWCGYTDLGRGLVHILAAGVYLSGFIKDLLCIPRPLSPPLQRISMSTSASLEYGFPSSHSTNAASVAIYALFLLHSPDAGLEPWLNISLQVLSYVYMISIVFGRVYCGMHGFLDVTIGTALGAFISVIQWHYEEAFDNVILNGSFKVPFLITLALLVLVRIHPEPADDCPCFDDSVAFAGCLMGIEIGFWHYSRSGLAWDSPVPATVPFVLEYIGWPRAILRIITGVFVVFAWREIMKPTLFRILPPIFRVIEDLGLNQPRRYFKQATEYTEVPEDYEDDNVIPYASSIPSLLRSIRHPRRRLSVTLGPVSQADAYEALAYREKRRRESTTETDATRPKVQTKSNEQEKPPGYFSTIERSSEKSSFIPVSARLPTPVHSEVDLYQKMMGAEIAVEDPLTPASQYDTMGSPSRSSSQDRRAYEKEEREMLSTLEKTRVRYDVEVITKLIVYMGIAWLAVEGVPLLFSFTGLNVSSPVG